MIKVYKAFNPLNGEYTTHLTLDECLTYVMQISYEFYLHHTHGQPYSVVTKVDDAETWRTPEGDEIPNPDKLLNLINAQTAKLKTKLSEN